MDIAKYKARGRHTFWPLVIGCFCLMAVGCTRNKRKPQSRLDNTIAQSISPQTKQVFDSTQLDDFFSKYSGLKDQQSEIYAFYLRRNYAYAWFEDGKLTEYAGNFYNRLLNLQDEGVNDSIPYLRVLDSLMHLPIKKVPLQSTELEIMLSTQYLLFAKNVWAGAEDAEAKTKNWLLPRKKLSFESLLDSMVQLSGKGNPEKEPMYRQYSLLRNYLAKYRVLERKVSWQPLRITSAGSVENMDNDAIVALKKRLYHLGDYTGDTLNVGYDTLLTDAVKQYQERHGLTPNGQVNSITLKSLNAPLRERIKQILINMERCRWLPETQNGYYVAVNIPEFKIHVYHNDTLLWSSAVVVGKTMHQTTIFSGKISYLVFNPYWNVPASIVKSEILPAMAQDGNYLKKHNMETTGNMGGLPSIRQLPGSSNALGKVKFMFPNSYNIYLHDTPSKSLFRESARAFSHGCIRVSEPAKLAAFLLKDMPGWDPQKIQTAMQGTKERAVSLKTPVPVFIAYLTSFVDRNNRVNFRNDVYEMDKKLGQLLFQEGTP